MSEKAVPRAHRPISGATHLFSVLSCSPEMEVVSTASVKISAQCLATVSQEAIIRELKGTESWVGLGAPPLRPSDKPHYGWAGGR